MGIAACRVTHHHLDHSRYCCCTGHSFDTRVQAMIHTIMPKWMVPSLDATTATTQGHGHFSHCHHVRSAPAFLSNSIMVHASGQLGLTTISRTYHNQSYRAHPLPSLSDRRAKRGRRERIGVCLIFWHQQKAEKKICFGEKRIFHHIVF